jgi:hypothetical protein
MYSVEWLPSAEDELANLWNNDNDRASIAAAADAIDAALARNPFSVGESREQNSRIAFEPPLAVVFNVYPSSRHVEVRGIWKWPSRGE